MPDATRPLLVIPPARSALLRLSPGGGGSQAHPKKAKLVQRLEPKFAALQHVLELRKAELAASPEGFAPEQILVFETTAPSASSLVAALKETPSLSWLAASELANLDPDEDYYDKKNVEKPLSARLFMVMANHAALEELLSLWKLWSTSKRAKLPKAHKAWGKAFGCLRDVRLWSAKDRIEETGLAAYWEECKALGTKPVVEIELWGRASAEARQRASGRVRALVAAVGGVIKAESVIEQIGYHGLLAQLSISSVESLLLDAGVALVRSDDVHLFRPTPQQPTIVEPIDLESEDLPPTAQPLTSKGAPRVALLDGLPLQNHVALQGHLIVDDPDKWEDDYPAACRRHGTAMASLIVHGDRNVQNDPPLRPIYVRPILRPRDDLGSRPEEAPQDELWIDVIHRAVVRIVGSDARAGVAPEVRVINLSVGDRFRPFVRDMSPLARLMDWLSWQHQILFVVSAGNHADAIELEAGIDSEEVRALRALQRGHRHRRLLCPSESINALTVGSLHADEAGAWSPKNIDEVDVVTTSGLPSLVSALGRGYRKSVKPDLLAPGGRVVFVRDLANRNRLSPALARHLHAPGQKTAAPKRGFVDHEQFSAGSSNAAALVTRASMHILETVESLQASSPVLTPLSPALLAKCLLVHTSTWSSAAKTVLEQALKNAQTQSSFRDHVGAYIGYGALRPERALACALTRATLVGGGSVRLGTAVEHRIPLPPSLNAYTGWRRVTVTLAWFSPVKSSTRNYRVAALDVKTTFERSGLAVIGADADGNAAKRGTVQHVVLEGDVSAVNVLDDAEIVLAINAVEDAEAGMPVLVPYALAVTFEVPEGRQIPVYDEIRARLAQRVRV